MTPTEYAALLHLKIRYGRNWKSRLRLAWRTDKYDGLASTPAFLSTYKRLRCAMGSYELSRVRLGYWRAPTVKES